MKKIRSSMIQRLLPARLNRVSLATLILCGLGTSPLLRAEFSEQGIGNPATLQHVLTGTLNEFNRVLGISFEIPEKSFEVASAYFETEEPQGGSFPVKVGFQAAFEGERGQLFPSGVWVDDVTVEAEISHAGIHPIQFSRPVSLDAQTPYFLVISAAEPAPSGALKVLLGNSQRSIWNYDETYRGPLPLFRPDDSIDPAYGIYSEQQTEDWGRADNWTAYVPIFLLVDPEGTPWGSPFLPNRSVALRGDQNMIVQEFAVPSGEAPREVSELVVVGRMTSPQHATLDVDVAVTDATSGRVLGTALLHFSEPTPPRHIAGEFYSATFQSPLVLEPGNSYRLELQVQDLSEVSNCFFMAKGLPSTWAENVPESSKLQNLSTARGAEVSSDGGMSFRAPEDAWANMLFQFR